jgi:hypothetical protein
MARKNLIHSYALFSAESPVTTTSTSSSTNVEQLDYASIDFQWASSDLVATVEVQAKNGKNGDWRALDFGGTISVSGASGSHEILMTQMPFTDLRMTITVTGGSSGEVDAVITAKSEGA